MHLELPSRDTVGFSVPFDLPSQLYFDWFGYQNLQSVNELPSLEDWVSRQPLMQCETLNKCSYHDIGSGWATKRSEG
jgi:hypothetical protein